MTTYRALATKTATVTTGAVSSISDFSFDAGDLVAARRAIVSATTNDVMTTWSGVDPTSVLGHPVAALTATCSPTTLVLRGPSLVDIKLIALGGSATVTITLER